MWGPDGLCAPRSTFSGSWIPEGDYPEGCGVMWRTKFDEVLWAGAGGELLLSRDRAGVSGGGEPAPRPSPISIPRWPLWRVSFAGCILSGRNVRDGPSRCRGPLLELYFTPWGLNDLQSWKWLLLKMIVTWPLPSVHSHRCCCVGFRCVRENWSACRHLLFLYYNHRRNSR